MSLGIGLKIKYPDKTVAGWMGSRVGGMLFKRDSLSCLHYSSKVGTFQLI